MPVQSSPLCVSCGKSEHDVPLLSLHFKGIVAHICSSCLPVLIHHPERLAGKLPGSEEIAPTPHRG